MILEMFHLVDLIHSMFQTVLTIMGYSVDMMVFMGQGLWHGGLQIGLLFL
jgi:hypothetical protein